MDKKIPFSVLTAVYKNDDKQNFASAMDSIIQQTVLPEEIVVMQDGPVGVELSAVIGEYKQKYPQLITHVVNPQNVGLGLTLARGVEVCRNELIARMDADDIACRNRFELQIKEFQHDTELALLGGYIREFDTDPKQPQATRTVPINQNEIYKRVKVRSPFNHMTVMFRKSMVLECGNYADLRNMQDYHLWIRMIHAGYRMKNIPVVLALARTGNGMYKRRGGKNYIKLEREIQQLMLNYKMINRLEYIRNLVIRVTVRKLGNRARKFIYMNFLRKG